MGEGQISRGHVHYYMRLLPKSDHYKPTKSNHFQGSKCSTRHFEIYNGSTKNLGLEYTLSREVIVGHCLQLRGFLPSHLLVLTEGEIFHGHCEGCLLGALI